MDIFVSVIKQTRKRILWYDEIREVSKTMILATLGRMRAIARIFHHTQVNQTYHTCRNSGITERLGALAEKKHLWVGLSSFPYGLWSNS